MIHLVRHSKYFGLVIHQPTPKAIRLWIMHPAFKGSGIYVAIHLWFVCIKFRLWDRSAWEPTIL
jgi:hypothetical protein